MRFKLFTTRDDPPTEQQETIGNASIDCHGFLHERSSFMMPKEERTNQEPFRKQYSVAIDTVPLPENPEERIQLVMKKVTPVINQIITDAMSVAIGTWPTPEKPRK